MNNNRCSCGRVKYSDAICCDKCWDKGRAYDEREYGNSNYCSCGKGKIADASMCDECWDRQSVYGD